MLSNLHIENIAVARRLDIDFSSGFTVITGKTGAGKSIIIDSLLLLCGSKHTRDLIRTGEDKAEVVGILRLTETEAEALREYDIDVDENGEIEIARYLTSDDQVRK